MPPINPLAELDNHLRTPYLEYTTGGFQWSFAPKWVLAMTGVHTLGVRGFISRNINVDQNFNTATPDAPLCQMYGTVAICSQFGAVPWVQNGDHLHYNAFVVALQKNMSDRFLFNTSYTLSKAENESDDSTGSTLASDPFNFRADYGAAQTDQRNRFIFSGVFDPSHLPPFFGKGWQISLISSFSTPLPFSITEASPAPDGKHAGAAAGNSAQCRRARRSSAAIGGDQRLSRDGLLTNRSGGAARPADSDQFAEHSLDRPAPLEAIHVRGPLRTRFARRGLQLVQLRKLRLEQRQCRLGVVRIFGSERNGRVRQPREAHFEPGSVGGRRPEIVSIFSEVRLVRLRLGWRIAG